ncbi:chromodomain-helicase-DNA-binding protein 6-like [Notechis scutatus]|uniref:Chromodomain-helicase-DNA-binding protein 6-like n=1 Tax=Notechis scutatus TaxID=8663 RepID=A0A6J1VV93_9SAUR|nr:chromodomain-helicase-DNA-binding protein 6-like [Notechis scutatus]
MNSGNDPFQAENISQDGSCENFMSKVRSMISANYDESSLPDSLSCMLYDEKACNSEHSSFARDSPSCTDISSNATKVAEGKTDGDEDLSSCDAETIRESTYLDHLQFGSDQLEGQHIGQELSEKEAKPSESFVQETCNALQHMENQYISPKAVPFERDGMESVLSIGVYGPSLHNFDIKVQPEKRLMGLLHEKSLEEKLIQSQSHSEEEEEEEEEEEDHLETVADIGKDRGKAKCSTQEEQKHNSCILTTLDALMEERNKVLVESVSSELAASKYDSEPGMGEDDQVECETLEEHTPSLQEIQTCHHHYHHSARSQASAIQVELLKSHPVCMEGDLWGDDSEEKRESPITQSLYESEIKREEEECEHQDLDKRDGIHQNQDGFEKFSEDESKSSAFAVPGESDELHDVRAPTIAQLLQEKTLYSFSEWPKDRVIINRIDNICHAILKGKWPSSSQSFDIPYIMPTPALVSSTCNRSGYTEPEVSESSFSNGVLATQLPKETFLAPTFVKDESKHRQSYEFEMERDVKHRSLDQLVASHSHPSAVLNGWRDTVDLSRVPDGTSASSTPFSMSTNIPKLGTMNALQGSLGMDLSGILQAGLIHPVTGQIVNGSLRRDDAAIRRRRVGEKMWKGLT